MPANKTPSGIQVIVKTEGGKSRKRRLEKEILFTPVTKAPGEENFTVGGAVERMAVLKMCKSFNSRNKGIPDQKAWRGKRGGGDQLGESLVGIR